MRTSFMYGSPGFPPDGGRGGRSPSAVDRQTSEYNPSGATSRHQSGSSHQGVQANQASSPRDSDATLVKTGRASNHSSVNGDAMHESDEESRAPAFSRTPSRRQQALANIARASRESEVNRPEDLNPGSSQGRQEDPDSSGFVMSHAITDVSENPHVPPAYMQLSGWPAGVPEGPGVTAASHSQETSSPFPPYSAPPPYAPRPYHAPPVAVPIAYPAPANPTNPGAMHYAPVRQGGVRAFFRRIGAKLKGVKNRMRTGG